MAIVIRGNVMLPISAMWRAMRTFLWFSGLAGSLVAVLHAPPRSRSRGNRQLFCQHVSCGAFSTALLFISPHAPSSIGTEVLPSFVWFVGPHSLAMMGDVADYGEWKTAARPAALSRLLSCSLSGRSRPWRRHRGWLFSFYGFVPRLRCRPRMRRAASFNCERLAAWFFATRCACSSIHLARSNRKIALELVSGARDSLLANPNRLPLAWQESGKRNHANTHAPHAFCCFRVFDRGLRRGCAHAPHLEAGLQRRLCHRRSITQRRSRAGSSGDALSNAVHSISPETSQVGENSSGGQIRFRPGDLYVDTA